MANSLERKYSGKFIKKNGTYAFYYENDRKKFEKEANQKGVQLKTRSANTEEKNQMFIDWVVKTKMSLGFGTYNSHKIKVINGKIHMQFDRYCYVYRPL